MEYELDAGGRITAERSAGEEFLPRDDVILAIGQENAFPWIERDLGVELTNGTCRWSTRRRFNRRGPGCSSAATPRLGRRTSSGRSSRATSRPSPFHRHCHGEALSERLAPGINLQSRKMGMHEWSYANDYSPSSGG